MPDLVRVPATAAAVDVRLQVGTGTAPLPPTRAEEHSVDYSNRDGAVRFVIGPAGDRIRADWRQDSLVKRDRDLTALLVGPILGTVLRIRGVLSLHACVLEVASRAVVVMGEAGTGKSTFAAMLGRLGYPILSDDVAALTQHAHETWVAHPGCPRVRLSPDACRAIGLSIDEGGIVYTSLPKRYLELSNAAGGPWRFGDRPLALQAIYLLERDTKAPTPSIQPLDRPSQVAALIGHLRPIPIRLGREILADELEQLVRLSGDVEVRRLRCPEGLEAVTAAGEMLVRNLEEGSG